MTQPTRPGYVRSRIAFLTSVVGSASVATWILIVAGVHLVAIWFNGGFLNADEHYQILEFAQYKLGRQDVSSLAWEFPAQMRPALQPWIAAGTIRLANAAGVASPFVIAFALRLLSTTLALWMALELCVRCLRDVQARWLKVAALLGSFLFWLDPMTHGRFSSENWGGALLVGGICLVLDASEAWSTRRAKAIALTLGTGLVWSAAFYCRFQLGFAIAGAGLWLVFVRRTSWSLLATLAVAFLAGCALNVVLDHWLYGVWVLTPYKYFMVNLVGGKAATFGVSPWWMLTAYMAVVLIPPYSLAILALLIAGSWYARRHVLVWVTLPFLFAHTVIAHKEPRFLTPVLFVVGPWFAVCLAALPVTTTGALTTWIRSGVGRAIASVWLLVNLLLLCAAALMPANDLYPIQHWVWQHARNSPMVIYTVGDSPYLLARSDVVNSFYRSGNVTEQPFGVAGGDTLDIGQVPAYFFYRGLEVPPAIRATGTCVPVVQTFPPWLVRLDLFRQLASVDQATICRVDAPRPR